MQEKLNDQSGPCIPYFIKTDLDWARASYCCTGLLAVKVDSDFLGDAADVSQERTNQ